MAHSRHERLFYLDEAASPRERDGLNGLCGAAGARRPSRLARDTFGFPAVVAGVPLIEAYLLADLADEAIAHRVGAPPEAIRWYRLAFYDVQHWLRFPLYVRMHLIRVIDEDGQTRLDMHRLWKLVAYTLGAQALDQLLDPSLAGKEAFNVGGIADRSGQSSNQRRRPADKAGGHDRPPS
jgi:hypothetical protein